MFRFSVRKNWKVRQVSRVGTVASLVFCLVVRAQADSTARATQQHKGSSKTAETAPADKGYYSYDLGDWHIVVLNTNCNAKALGGCDTGSPEETWLRSDLAKYPNACILAYGHHPLFSSGLFKKHALHPSLRSFWEDLYAVHADLIL